jgi:uncharacterized protein
MSSFLVSQELSAVSPPLPIRPVEKAERVQLLDVLRGFAIFGILLANMLVFSGYMFAEMASADLSGYWGAAADGALLFLIHVLVDGKFYSLFSFLFGVGFAVQMLRAQEKGVPFVPLFFRYGPAEWLWRTLTYGRLQPFRNSSPASAEAVPVGA